jgi:hypothetical protein
VNVDPTGQRYVVGFDVGQATDYSALVILHSYRSRHKDERDPFAKAVEKRHHDLVHAERFREIPYPDQIRRVAERYGELQRHAKATNPGTTTTLAVDATGVGKPILDAMREAGLRPHGILITSGETASRGDGLDRVPKRVLATTMQVALQAGRLRIAEDLPLAHVLLRELRGFRVKITLTGYAKFGNDVGAWREADNDDLVLATAIAVWTVENRGAPSLAAMRKAAGIA